MGSNAVAQWAHDIRNTLGTVALYLESLERPSNADPAKVLTRSEGAEMTTETAAFAIFEAA